MRVLRLSMMVLLVGACGGDDETCDPVARSGCDDGKVCEVVQGGEPACFAPVAVRGQVFDMTDDTGVQGARVVAIDPNGQPSSSVAISDMNGDYSLEVPTTRTEDGTPVSADITLRADALGYATFPSGVRQAIPVGITAPVDMDGVLVVESAATDIGLLPLPAGSGTGTIHGTVEVPDDHAGVLVVADLAGAGFSAIADRDGDYAIFNVPAGTFTILGYARGVNYTPASIEVGAGASVEQDLAIADDATGIVSGSINIVNAPGGSMTSVILVVESTFIETLARGEAPPGLRAPEPGLAGNVSTAYTIEGVPAGRYVVLAAFENDGLVRDPDLSIGGTSILHFDVAAGQTTTVEGFKVTGALEVMSPGAAGMEIVTDPMPDFLWKDDSSEATYQIQVFDAFGTELWSETLPGTSGTDPTIKYGGAEPLQAGMIYQFRATSFSNAGDPIARTEDLKGVFQYNP